MEEQFDFLTIDEVKKILRVSLLTIYRYIQAGRIKVYKFGKEFRFNRKDFIQFIGESVYLPKTKKLKVEKKSRMNKRPKEMVERICEIARNAKELRPDIKDGKCVMCEVLLKKSYLTLGENMIFNKQSGRVTKNGYNPIMEKQVIKKGSKVCEDCYELLKE